MTYNGPVDSAFEEWKERARAAKVLDIAVAEGAKLRKVTSVERAGPCPFCGGEDGFAVNTKDNVFNCRRGGKGGDAIALVMHVRGCDFIAACEHINGEPPPKRGSHVRPQDPEIERERREQRREERIEEARQEAKEKSAAIIASTELFERGEPFPDSYADAYLDRRGVRLSEAQAVNLRFIPELEYFGFADAEAEDLVRLGAFPCMIGAIRDVAGDIIGIHRTYLDPERPRKLTPPGDRRRNAAKKVYRKSKGGVIWLGPIAETICMGEGIETSASYLAIPDLPSNIPDDIVAVSGVALGNMAGRERHLTDEEKAAMTPAQVADFCEPDFDEPGIILPDSVKRVILLGDGDSDPKTTRRKMMLAGKRFVAQGKEVDVHFAPNDADWNVVLNEMLRGAVA